MEKIIIYGTGKFGKTYFKLLQKFGMDNVIECFCDSNTPSVPSLCCGKDVLSYELAKEKNLPFFIAIKKSDVVSLLINMLETDDQAYIDELKLANLMGLDLPSMYREFCAEYHIESMDNYFDRAESENSLNRFWNEKLEFYPLFKNLDLDNVIELACGRGRHVQNYYKDAKNIVLVDILKENIDYCQDRYNKLSNISYYHNNGYDLRDLPDNTFTSIFTYDAMVHFEMFDIYNYLKDFNRVLKRNGLGLFHHSNSSQNSRTSFINAKHGRNYMSKEIFEYISLRCGFEVVQQVVIDWGGVENLDCISLIKKI